MLTEPLPAAPVAARLRAPATWLLGAALAGIALDRWQQPPVIVGWSLLLLGLGFALASGRRPRFAAASLLVSWGALFGLWHHTWWADPPPGSIYHHATDLGEVVALRGRVVEPAWLRERPGELPQVVCLIAAQALQDAAGTWRETAGHLRLMVDLAQPLPAPPEWRAGTELEIVGRLVRPSVAGQPGGFDYRQWLRAQGVTALVRAQHLVAVEVRASSPTSWEELRNWRHAWRTRAGAELRAGTDPALATVAEALLLGTRSPLGEDLRNAFLASGTLHVLAISGLNIAILWWGLMRAVRLCGLRSGVGDGVVIGMLLLYAWLTDANPPLVRAVTFAITLQLAELSGRRVGAWQALSLAALIVLARNPTDAFSPGAWLSFLAVGVLSLSQRWLRARDFDEADRLEAALPKGWLAKCHDKFRRMLRDGAVTSTTVWLTTAPLVAWRFHFVSFSGLLLNIVLGPWIGVLLWVGYLWLLVYACVPMLSSPLLWVFAALLRGLIAVITWVGAWDQGAGWFVGPPGWWLAGFYLGLWWTLRPPGWWTWRRQWRTGLTWVNVGLAAGLLPTAPRGLVCDILDVGHGLAIVLRGPDGRVLLYDCGSLSGGELAAETMSLALWQAGCSRIDGLILSHADADHCNGVALLTKRFRPGLLLKHGSFDDSPQPTVDVVRNAWRDAGGAETTIAAGDRIEWDAAVRTTVWLPGLKTRYPRDNANSLVLAIEYAGRRIVLTGDLEQGGLVDLLARPRDTIDLFLAPHHGSPRSNIDLLGAWAHPGWVVLSAADPRQTAKLADRYPADTPLLNTAAHGRIRTVITPDGDLTVETFR
jgi:competence protein ComEC